VLYPAELRDQPGFELSADFATCKMMTTRTGAVTDQPSPFILYPDPRLAEAAVPRPVDPALIATGQRLLAAAQRVNAYGLAAAHIGEVAPVAVISIGDPADRDYRILHNPRIVSAAGQPVSGPEGSVSMPGLEVDVLRAPEAVIGFDDESGQGRELSLSGFAARVALHEIDQVNGIFFLNRLSRLKREAAIRRYSKLNRRDG
jgi:peptide deformylase